MKSTLIALSIALAAAVTVTNAAPADVSGTWSIDGDVMGNPVKFTCSLKQEGNALSGTANLGEGKEAAVTGTLEESTVTLEYDTEHEGTAYHLVFTGTLGEDGAIKGTIAVAGVEGTFTATRQ